MYRKKTVFILLLVCLMFPCRGQEAGFGFDDEAAEKENAFKITFGGEVRLGGTLFFDRLKSAGSMRPGLPISSDIHLRAEAPLTEAYLGVRLDDTTLPLQLGEPTELLHPHPQIPRWIDEVYLKLLLGPVIVSGGIQKLTWGRTDMLSVLDTVNPHDTAHFSWQDSQRSKIARPLFSLSAYLPYSIKLETVFLPVFEGNHAALEGRWKDRRISAMADRTGGMPPQAQLQSGLDATASLQYAQGGIRLTGTVFDTHDFGIQYFYGRLPEPSLFKSGGTIQCRYDPYHHIGFDYGTSIGPVSLSAELCANVTYDTVGTDPFVHNTFLAWNTGLDYSAPYGFRLSTAVSERIRLQHDRITAVNDIERDEYGTETRILVRAGQSLLRNSLEWNIAASADVEDGLFCIMPGVQWMVAAFKINCDAFIFAGLPAAKNRQLYNNSLIRFLLSYSF